MKAASLKLKENSVPVPAEIVQLVKDFSSQQESSHPDSINETELRVEYINPFFEALGWDVTNQNKIVGINKDVVHEDAVKIEGNMKAPDYSFRVAGKRKFFVETKRPSVNIKKDPSPAFQLRRYAWTVKLSLSILTDFEEFAVYDCLIHRPRKKDKASKCRRIYLKYTEYADRWDEIAAIFSREAVFNGSLDKFAEEAEKKRGTEEVDTEFLKEIENWRTLLACNFTLRNRNPKLSQRELNFAVQKTIDRIIFLRICEDRGIEKHNQLKTLLKGTKVYSRLCIFFQQADDRYNSGLFHFHKEKDRLEDPDEFTLSLKVDDNVLKQIIKSLYYPDSPYEFSVIPADILGQVYEQFLGKVIRLTKRHQAKIEEKPEVKKAGGVYYTPTYIVEYIVDQTIGKLLEGKSPQKIGGLTKTWKQSKAKEPLTILDPACGSGSFLIVAYQKLLDWYRDWYFNDGTKKHRQRIYEVKNGEWRLTSAERKRILLSHIYGVDIDSQAVEVTKLSLLLKVLEGENQDAIDQQLKLFKERALPDLVNNIKCGNSLIGPDYYHGQQMNLSDEEEILKINAFNWEAEYTKTIKSGGFDVVIGNPPYVDVKILGDDIKVALIERYKSASRRFDLYIPFIEKGLQLTKKNGWQAYILPSMFAKRDYGKGIRSVISKSGRVAAVVDFGSNQVFKGPMNYVSILINEKILTNDVAEITRFDRWGLSQYELQVSLVNDRSNLCGTKRFQMKQSDFRSDSEWYLRTHKEKALIKKTFRRNDTLDTIIECASEGIHSGKDSVFFIKKDIAVKLGLESPPVYPLAKGKDVHRYDSINVETLPNVVIYPYDLENGDVLEESVLQTMAPNTLGYLNMHRRDLSDRTYFEKSNKKWYELWCQRSSHLYTHSKIIGPEIAAHGEFTLSEKPLFFNNKIKGIILRADVGESIKYLLGVLNSALLVYLHRVIAPPKGSGFFEVKTRILSRLPIRRIDFSISSDQKNHDRIVLLVEQILHMNKRLPEVKTSHQKNTIKRQIENIDNQINQLVYKLYGITKKEIKLIEESVT